MNISQEVIKELIAQLNNLRWKLVDKNQVTKVLEIDKKIQELNNELKKEESSKEQGYEVNDESISDRSISIIVPEMINFLDAMRSKR